MFSLFFAMRGDLMALSRVASLLAEATKRTRMQLSMNWQT
ncbi:hypothetical protein C1752_00578 [Acaryochloris thomasi RCC1774]|uniref:Uncharacterized protein n=1 Tax=Acaryochloris thomasi RCC1774 TaxID=1764569 RepID=A0A2W1JNQ3_9CYAN|nr:hypothetical protein C1752_00578 [Acaryochloris thomasi RCC1774]